MKKYKLIIMIIILIVFLSGCTLEIIDINDIITKPVIKEYGLNGTWVLVENVEILGDKIDRKEIQIGERALFKDKYLYLSGKYTRNANFVLKNLTVSDYFSSKYKEDVLIKVLGTNKIKVIDIYDDDEFLIKVVKLSKDRILIEQEENFLIYERINKDSSIDEIESYIEIDRKTLKKDKVKYKTNEKVGLLLGIKREIEDNLWEYETLYIKYDKGRINNYKMNNILLPRKTGFFNVTVKRNNDGNDIIILSSDKSDYKSKISNSKNKKNIFYLGNDYISFEKLGKNYNKLGVYPLDYIESDRNIKMSEVLKKDDVNKLKFFTRNRKEQSLDEFNFAIKRKSGYWAMENREIIKDGSEYQWRDYELNIPTPKAIVNYDELPIPMWELKNKIDGIKDAFIAPKVNLLLADIGEELIIYEINHNREIGRELDRIKKYENESIIMAEWATGEYSDIWEEEVKKYK